MKTSEILKRAKVHLWDGAGYRSNNKHFGVCIAIATVMDENRRSKVIHRKAQAVIDRIEEALGKSAYVVEWLLTNGHATKEQVYNYQTMQEYRHRWLDALIKEYKSKGD